MGIRPMRRDIDKVVFERAKGGRTWAKKTPRAKQVVSDVEGEQLKEQSNWRSGANARRRGIATTTHCGIFWFAMWAGRGTKFTLRFARLPTLAAFYKPKCAAMFGTRWRRIAASRTAR